MAFHQTIAHGRIGREIELKYSNSGAAVAKFSVAVSEKYKGEEKTTWYNVVAFNATAENISKYFSKGAEIIIIGTMSFGSYEKDGVTRYTSDLIVRSFDFCGSKQQDQPAQQNNGFQGNPSANNGGFQPNNGGFQNNQPGGNAGFQAPPDDDIPF